MFFECKGGTGYTLVAMHGGRGKPGLPEAKGL